MQIFTLDAGNTIAVSTSGERVWRSVAAQFTTEKQFAALAAHWPGGRLVEIWNNLTGVRKVEVQGPPNRRWPDLGCHPRVRGPWRGTGDDNTSNRGNFS